MAFTKANLGENGSKRSTMCYLKHMVCKVLIKEMTL